MDVFTGVSCNFHCPHLIEGQAWPLHGYKPRILLEVSDISLYVLSSLTAKARLGIGPGAKEGLASLPSCYRQAGPRASPSCFLPAALVPESVQKTTLFQVSS